MPRRRSALRVAAAVTISAVVQLASTAAVLGLHGRRGPRGFGGPPGPMALEPGAHPPGVWLAAALIALAVIGPALLIVLRRRPGPVLVVITAAAIAGTVVCASRGYGAPFYLSVPLGVGAATFLRHRAWAWSCAGAYWLGFALSYLFADPIQLAWLVPLTVLTVGALAGPEFARGRQEARARFRRDAEARRLEETQAERVRIARELHDVLAHSLSQINVQASVGLHLFDAQPAKAAEALASIKDTSKQALGDVRQVLGMLRGDAPLSPEPELSGLEALVAGVRAQGIDATLALQVADAARLPAPVQQAAYRLVQEALTNVTRHARARHVKVVVAESGPWLRLTITDDGIGAKSSPPSAASPTVDAQEPATTSGDASGRGRHGGRGLIGMRERAELLGGSFSAGARPGGGFEVRAELPIGGAR